MHRWRGLGVVLFTGALLGAGGWLAYRWLFPAYTIIRQMHAGEQWQYHLVQSLQLGNQTATLDLRYTETVQKVNPDGSAIVERVLIADPQTLRDLQESAAPLGAIPVRTRWRISPQGEETPLINNAAVLTLGSSSKRLMPPKAVRIGEQWERESQIGSLKIRARCQLKRIVPIDGVPCYEITATLESPPDSLPRVQGHLTCYLDRRTGWTRKEQGTIVMTSGTVQFSSQVSLKGRRIRAGQQPKE